MGGDAQLTDFIEGEYLKEQVEAQKEMGDLITKMKRAGDALGLHIIDKELQSPPPTMSLRHCLHQSSFIINFACSISSASLSSCKSDHIPKRNQKCKNIEL